MSKQRTLGTVLLCVFLACASCGSSSPPEKNHSPSTNETLKIEAKPNVTTLYYSGFIKPIQTLPVNNIQADGVITEKNFEYGELIRKGQLLFIITSQQLAKNYHDALSSYLRSKKSYTDTQAKMTEAEELKKLKILSEQDYASAKTQLFNAELDIEQSTSRLQEVLSELGIDAKTISQFDIADPKAVNAILSKSLNSVRIVTPTTGIALLPDEGSKESGGSKTPLKVGSQVKSAQNLLLVGDMSGVSVTVKITEIYIDKLKAGQKAIVTSEAFPGISLEGYVSHVDRQAANEGSGGGVPTFTVDIIVPKLTKEAFDKIRVGMSADVAFPISLPPAIKVPLTAVFTEGKQSMVKKIDPAKGKTIDTPVTTGRTDIDSIEITQGLSSGDEVVVNATTH